MMAMPVWCEVVCRQCADSTAGQYTWGAIPRKAIRAVAVREGWLFKHRDVFCSQRCLDTYEREVKP